MPGRLPPGRRGPAGDGPSGPAPASARSTTSGSRMASRPLEVPLARRGEEGVDDRALPGGIGRGCGSGCAARAAAAWPGWPAAWRRPGNGPGSGPISLERHGEDVVQHEREPLGGRQRVEDDEQRETDRVGQQRMLARVVAGGVTIGSGTCTSSGSSRRAVRERSMSRQTRDTTVVSQARRFRTSPASVRSGAARPPAPRRPPRSASRASGRPPPAGARGAPGTAPPCRPVSSRVHCYLPPPTSVIPRDDPDGIEVTTRRSSR